MPQWRFGAWPQFRPFDGRSSRFRGEAPARSQLTGPRVTGTPVEMPSSSRAAVTGRVVRTSQRTLSSETPVAQMRAAEQSQDVGLGCVRPIVGAACVVALRLA